MSIDGQDTLWRRNIAENFNRLSRAHERYRQMTDRRQTDGRRQIANVNVSSRSLKIKILSAITAVLVSVANTTNFRLIIDDGVDILV